MMRCVGYVRVSSEEQAGKGASLDWQKGAIAEECARRGWELVDMTADTASAGSMRGRAGLQRALERLDRHDFDALVVARLDRLSRSVGDFARIMERAHARGWSVVVMDPAVDMTSPFGEAMASMAAVFAQLERRLIAQRTRDGIAEKKRQGTFRGGYALPQCQPVSELVAARIVHLSTVEGLSSREVARRLDLEGVPSHRGGPWRHSTVIKVLARARGAQAA
jgi:DNA invertase Pin-like site-specific DNA recombinase